MLSCRWSESGRHRRHFALVAPPDPGSRSGRDRISEGYRKFRSIFPIMLEGELIVTTSQPTTAERAAAPWHDTTLPVAERVDLLLGHLTLEEKVAQLGSRWVGNEVDPPGVDTDAASDEPDDGHNVAPM